MASRRDNRKIFKDLDTKDQQLSKKIEGLMRLHPLDKRITDRSRLEDYEKHYSMYEQLYPYIEGLGARLDDIVRTSQLLRGSKEWATAYRVYYKERKRLAAFREYERLKTRAPKKALAKLKEATIVPVGRPRKDKDKDEVLNPDVVKRSLKFFGHTPRQIDDREILLRQVIKLMSPADLDRADALLSTWILEDLEGDNQLIGRYVGSRLDKLSTRINALQETTHAQ